jgi:multisubunit Na+/H+ antiporter MnhG subunit
MRMADRSTSRSETTYLPPSAPPTNHGHTTAAWFTTFLTIGGFLLAAIGLVATITWLFWAGVVITVLGPVTGKVLQTMGYGQGGDKTLAKERRRQDEGRAH